MTAPHPFSLTAPAVITLQPDAAGTFTVVNSGSQPLTVHEALGRYNVKSLQYPAASHATLTAFDHPWIAVGPASFTLAPGHSETVRISSKVPAGTQGNHYLNIVWTAQPAVHGAGNLHLAGSVATTVQIPLAGVAVPVTDRGLARAPAVPGGGFSTMLLLIPAVLLVLVLAVAVVVRRARRSPA